ncbi:MAG: ATP-binding protein [Planctomycetota bacterium]
MDQEPGGIEIVIDDLARQVDPGTIQGRDLDDIRPGGLGVYIIREIMDKVEFACRPEGGMSLTMFKQLSSTSNTDESSGGDTAQAETSERR